MPSPFPGMNPYLEQNDVWEDFHQRFITHAGDELSSRVGGNYLVKVETRLYLHEWSGQSQGYFARGVAVITTPVEAESFAPIQTSMTAPVVLQVPESEVIRQSHLEIRDRRNRRVVTVIELLSPTNKVSGSSGAVYREKRKQIFVGNCNLVEIDLLRSGVRPDFPPLPTCDYYVLVSRYREYPKVGCWPIQLRKPIPSIPIPLSPSDPEIALDLQALLHRVYDAARYDKYIYESQPEPPLRDEEAQWAKGLIPS